MIKKTLFISVILMIVNTFFIYCSEDSPGTSQPPPDQNGLTGVYLGETPPGTTPVEFAEDFFNEEYHSPAFFSPDGNEVYWTPMNEISEPIQYMRKINGDWTDPQDFPLLEGYYNGEPFFSYDGNRLYFISRIPPETAGLITKENIWYVERDGENWSTPVVIGPEVNSLYLHWTFSLTADNHLYFAASEIDQGNNDIYCSRYIDGQYTEAVRLESPINTDVYEDTPFIASDESYLIISRRAEGELHTDMLISFQNPDGTWTEPENMVGINSGGHELAPYVSYDGEYLFFLSSRTGVNKTYWVDSQVIEVFGRR